jgi:hypothetical protein
MRPSGTALRARHSLSATAQAPRVPFLQVLFKLVGGVLVHTNNSYPGLRVGILGAEHAALGHRPARAPQPQRDGARGAAHALHPPVRQHRPAAVLPLLALPAQAQGLAAVQAADAAQEGLHLAYTYARARTQRRGGQWAAL